MNRLAQSAHKEKQRLYDDLWGHWCTKHQTAQEYIMEGAIGRWRCPLCRKEIGVKHRKAMRSDPVWRAAEKRRYRKWVKERRAKDPEYNRKYNKLRHASHMRRLQRNPVAALKHEARLKAASYRRRSLEDANPITAETLRLFRETYTYCLNCGETHDLTIDHIIPLAKGGGSEFLNIQCLCRVCNSNKGVAKTDYRVRIPEK
jgi:5-methylcytosine-specific restriction endonuclease McrA